MRPRLVVMGASGCGKSTVGAALADEMNLPFVDADSLHSEQNKAKMVSGIPLDDVDRWPWLQAVGEALADAAETGMVMACSALKRSYRDKIRLHALRPPVFIHLAGDPMLIAARLAARRGHFMPPTLLESQFADLEPLQPDEHGFALDVGAPVPVLTARIIAELAESGSHAVSESG